ncbi:PadR family transcriptional regulator [Pseudarthrobacter sulfonivorans]|uniref:PadR family transcriptional regulator n=1 Tax=Pseudarthrobacter sulfonivorans TaxID=121292 RepID=UPI0028616C83|nr:PadR family transcriptional regulator [Pseudarthrobacter sulfonivorans]MDR6416332.1 DNA-binding PadR family transcriptional regulator [Pseudarthrobacter sulfonivorans]
MSLRYALLALLTVEPMTGYDLAKRFESSVAFVWHAPDSQIYPELRKMAKESLLAAEEISWGPNGKKTRYRITPEGRAAFRQWMNTPLEYSRERDPVHLKAAYLEWAEPSAARQHMQAHIDYHTMRRAQWTEMIAGLRGATNEMLNKRLAATAEEDRRRTLEYKIFTYEGLIARAETEIEWGLQGLRLIDSLSAPSQQGG